MLRLDQRIETMIFVWSIHPSKWWNNNNNGLLLKKHKTCLYRRCFMVFSSFIHNIFLCVRQLFPFVRVIFCQKQCLQGVLVYGDSVLKIHLKHLNPVVHMTWECTLVKLDNLVSIMPFGLLSTLWNSYGQRK